MKKQIVSIAAAAMLLAVASMTGCGAVQQDNSSDVISTDTTSLNLTTEESSAAAETQADSVVETELGSQETGQSNLTFDSYDAFLDAMGTYYPGVVMVAPNQIVSGEWEVMRIELLTSGEQPFYGYTVMTPEGQSLMLTVSGEMQFDSMDALVTQLESSTVQVQDGYTGSNWVIGLTTEPDMYVLYGLTGDESVYYTLIGSDTDGSTLEPTELQTLHDVMCL